MILLADGKGGCFFYFSLPRVRQVTCFFGSNLLSESIVVYIRKGYVRSMNRCESPIAQGVCDRSGLGRSSLYN